MALAMERNVGNMFLSCNMLTIAKFSCREIKQKNEGGWEFSWDDDNKKNDLILEVKLSKFLDSSLIDVDVHPTYVSMVIKNKVRGDDGCYYLDINTDIFFLLVLFSYYV